MLLKDKVVIISGVGPGMGQSMAKLAAREGAKVGMGARNQEYLDSVAAEIKDNGGEVVAICHAIPNKNGGLGLLSIRSRLCATRMPT